MKILKWGEVPNKTKVFKCAYCGTEFEAEFGEYRNADQFAYVCEGITAYCTCPVCGKCANSRR